MLIHCHWYKTFSIGCKGCTWHDWVCTKRIGLYLLHLACYFVTRNAKKEKEVNKFKVVSDKFAPVHHMGKEVLTNAFFVTGCCKELIIIWQVCISSSIIQVHKNLELMFHLFVVPLENTSKMVHLLQFRKPDKWRLLWIFHFRLHAASTWALQKSQDPAMFLKSSVFEPLYAYVPDASISMDGR